jgi:3-phosphoshikimate 1-carboxyvinyltransferase
MTFHYRGRIPGSKSVLNRLLILKSFEPEIEIDGDSRADDVVKMKAALKQLERGELADCGAAGTTLRFMALRASRIPGHHNLSGSLRLFSRPQGEIDRILTQLGCEVQTGPQRLTIRGSDWQIPDGGVRIERSISSQFASALILSAWDLPKPLRISLLGSSVSFGYLQMTLETVREAGMNWVRLDESTIEIPAHSKILKRTFHVESDISSAFAIAALAAVSGEAIFEMWPEKTLQPDRAFVEILERMGCEVVRKPNQLEIRQPAKGRLKPIDVDLGDSPDLFPVLAVLCALADGKSRLKGAPHLVHKESNRVQKSAELIHLLGRKTTEIPGGLDIHGSVAPPKHIVNQHVSDYDPEHDHRLAMAAAVAKAAGFPLKLLRPDVVNKSFPEFWGLIEKAQSGGAHP